MNHSFRLLTIVYLLSSTLFLYSAQGANEANPQLAWLNRRLLELEQIKAGCTRAQVKELLQECDGFYSSSEQPFFDTACPFIKICANFKSPHELSRSMSDDDILVGRSRPYLEIDSYDHRDYPDENDASRTYYWLLESMEQMGKCAVGSTREELLTIFCRWITIHLKKVSSFIVTTPASGSKWNLNVAKTTTENMSLLFKIES